MSTYLLSLAYRAILAEPRSKANTSEDYTGGGNRGDYANNADSMNQYTFPMGMHVVYTLFPEENG